MQTIEEAIRHYEESERINMEFAEISVSPLSKNHNLENAEKCRQMIEWLRELQERRKHPEIIRCKDCKHYHTDVFGGELGVTGIWENIIVAHNACDKWTKDMNCVAPDGFCFLAERRTDATD